MLDPDTWLGHSTAWFFLLFGVLFVLVMIAGARRWMGYSKTFTVLEAWASEHGWTTTRDSRETARWAARFRFTDSDLAEPFADFAAYGRVYGREAMILFYQLPQGESRKPITITVVDAGANFPPTAVARHRGNVVLGPSFGNEVPLESIAFERRWRAMGWDAAASHAVFTPLVLQRLLEPIPGSQPEIVWDGPGVRAMDDSFIGDVTLLESRLLLLADLAGLTPGYQVTHANDPQYRPYVPPSRFRWTATAVDGAGMVKALGVLTWGAAVSMIFAPFSTVPKVVTVIVIAGVGLAIYLTGRRLERDAKARRLEKWRADHAPPPSAPPPSPPRPSPGP